MSDFKKVLDEIIHFRKTSSAKTSAFENLMHNDDLCPIYEDKLNIVLASFERYRKQVHDIQGIHDKGTDVYFRKNTSDGLEFTCIQIKSQDDLKKKDYLKILKSQHFDSKNNYQEMIDYYIFLCCDTSKEEFKGKVRNISQTFSKEPNVHVVEPEFTLPFYLINQHQIDAIVKNTLGSEDIVIKKTNRIFTEHTPTEIALLIYFCTTQILEGEEFPNELQEIVETQFLNDVLEKTKNHDREWFFTDIEDLYDEEVQWFQEEYMNINLSDLERITRDLDYLNNYIYRTDEDSFQINSESLYPLLTMILDGRVRYGYDKNDLMEYVFNLSIPQKGYEQDLDI